MNEKPVETRRIHAGPRIHRVHVRATREKIKRRPEKGMKIKKGRGKEFYRRVSNDREFLEIIYYFTQLKPFSI